MLIDLDDLKTKITPKTKGIVAVDYAGYGNDYEQINQICEQYNLTCIEDAAQGLGSYWKNRALGTFCYFKREETTPPFSFEIHATSPNYGIKVI